MVKYSRQMFQKTKKFVDEIIKLKMDNKIIYTPAIADASNISLLTYLGINFFDSLNAIISARDKNMFFTSGTINVRDIFENPCNCQICINLNKKPKDKSFKEILNHNYLKIFYELKNIKNHIDRKSVV